MSPKDHVSKAEDRQGRLQNIFEATVTAVGAVVTIITTAVRDFARTVGGLATAVFDIRDHELPLRRTLRLTLQVEWAYRQVFTSNAGRWCCEGPNHSGD